MCVKQETNQPFKKKGPNIVNIVLEMFCHCMLNSSQRETNESTSVAVGGLSD